jgi:hypothetical protein
MLGSLRRATAERGQGGWRALSVRRAPGELRAATYLDHGKTT